VSVGPRTGDARAAVTLELLRPYRAGSAAEEAHRLAMLRLLAETEDPFSRDQFDPGHLTASALVVAPATRRVLLIAHPTLGLWLQPGGHIEPDDASAVEAARREVLEETGIVALLDATLFDVDVHDIPARKGNPRHQHFDLRFLAPIEGEPPPAGMEGVEARWLSHDEAWHLTTDGSVRRMLDKAHVARVL
jgi:8-oxo-dGTP pyrophosphatase MutT (NUDIX family)